MTGTVGIARNDWASAEEAAAAQRYALCRECRWLTKVQRRGQQWLLLCCRNQNHRGLLILNEAHR